MTGIKKMSVFVFLSILWLGSTTIGLFAAQSVKSISFREDLSIGVREGDENYMFGNTIMMNADDKGNFYVTDWDRKRILKYDSSGKYLLTIGRQGQGPGEFYNISVARFDHEGNIYVLDFASRKIVFFDREGKYLNQVTLSENKFADLLLTPAGTYLGKKSNILFTSGRPQPREVYGIFDNQFKPLVELYSQTSDPIGPPTADPKARAEELSKSIFHPEHHYALGLDGRIYFGYSSTYTIDVYSAEGKKLQIITRDCKPLEVTRKDETEFFETDWKDEFVRNVPDSIRDQIKRFISFPKYKPFFKRLVPMENGWLGVVVDYDRSGFALFDLFDKDGHFLGRCKAAVPQKNLFFKNGKAYAVKDEDGYQFVKRYSYEIR